MNIDRIIIGTSQWGAKIDYKKSIKLGYEIAKSGFKTFDTAPNYGLGYAHKILNDLNMKEKIIVNSKIGQKMDLNFKELLLRIYRFNDLRSYLQSNYNLFRYSRLKKNKIFWNISNIESEYQYLNKTLINCDKKIFYLHSPPKEILNLRNLQIFQKFCENNKLIPGLTSIDDMSFDSLMYKIEGFQYQLSLNQYFRFENKIKGNLKIQINKIFKNSLEQTKIKKKNYLESVLDYFRDRSNVKLILGINSYNSLQKLINNLKKT